VTDSRSVGAFSARVRDATSAAVSRFESRHWPWLVQPLRHSTVDAERLVVVIQAADLHVGFGHGPQRADPFAAQQPRGGVVLGFARTFVPPAGLGAEIRGAMAPRNACLLPPAGSPARPSAIRSAAAWVVDPVRVRFATRAAAVRAHAMTELPHHHLFGPLRTLVESPVDVSEPYPQGLASSGFSPVAEPSVRGSGQARCRPHSAGQARWSATTAQTGGTTGSPTFQPSQTQATARVPSCSSPSTPPSCSGGASAGTAGRSRRAAGRRQRPRFRGRVRGRPAAAVNGATAEVCLASRIWPASGVALPRRRSPCGRTSRS
jgi:hypothetical protein